MGGHQLTAVPASTSTYINRYVIFRSAVEQARKYTPTSDKSPSRKPTDCPLTVQGSIRSQRGQSETEWERSGERLRARGRGTRGTRERRRKRNGWNEEPASGFKKWFSRVGTKKIKLHRQHGRDADRPQGPQIVFCRPQITPLQQHPQTCAGELLQL